MNIRTIQQQLLQIGRSLPSGVRRAILTAGARQPYFHPLAWASHYVNEADDVAWEPLRPGCSVLTPIHRKSRGNGQYLDVRLALRLDWRRTREYEHGTLGIEFGSTPALGGLAILTFRQERINRFETTRIRMPEEVVDAQFIRVRVLPAPHCNAGFYKLASVRVVKDHRRDPRLTRVADLEDLKARTRTEAAEAERNKTEVCNHFPVALTFELTAACNLSCSHCPSHGQSDLHRFHNKLAEISVEQLEALAADVFPSLTVISVVGRGEPMVLKNHVWNRLLELAAEYKVKLAITTNAYFLERRINPDVLPLIDNINISMDGFSPGVFATNRGGADINRVWRNVQFYDHLRRNAALARAPRLCFAYTLKKNNVAELADFVRKIATFDADLLTTRHLISFYESSKADSLLLVPHRETNHHLRSAYSLLEEFGIRRDCVPLFPEPDNPDGAAGVEQSQPVSDEVDPTTSSEERPSAEQECFEPPSNEPCMFIHRMPVIMAGGEVMVCAVPHAEKAGDLGPTTRFGDIWNGEMLKSFRRRLNTSDEWPQCRHCSYREGRVTTQQELAAEKRRYDSAQQGQFSAEALDFTKRD